MVTNSGGVNEREGRCPRCSSDRYTSLPFGNELSASGSASTYQCLICGSYFDLAHQEALGRFLLRRAPIAGLDEALPALDLDFARNVMEERRLGM